MRSLISCTSPAMSLARTSSYRVRAGDDLAPGLGGQCVIVRRRGVPATALGHVAYAAAMSSGRSKGASRRMGSSGCRAFHAMPWPTAG